jgi:two-component system, OmpR family, catabolic regulation response regulator CreB
MSPPRLILIVEDEPAIVDTLEYALRSEGFRTDRAATGEAALRRLSAGGVDLVVLDVGLPDGSGFEVCREIRRQSSVPVLFLTARASEVDRVLGLELGGDDYLAKPFSPRELTARVKAILRRTVPATGEVPTKGPAGLTIDRETMTVRCGGRPVWLTRYEFRLLATLAARPGRVFTRDQLMEAAWEDPGASLDRTVDAHIKTLRAKLRGAEATADPIRTHRGVGYSFDGGA